MGKFVNKVAVHWDIRPKLEKREVIPNFSELRNAILLRYSWEPLEKCWR